MSVRRRTANRATNPAQAQIYITVEKAIFWRSISLTEMDDYYEEIYCTDMILATERLVLRDFVEDDWPAVLAYQQNPLYLRYYEWSARSGEDVREFVQMLLDQQQADPRNKFQLAATLKSTGQLIGNCGIRVNSFKALDADIGYELDPHYWGHGYAIEAARAIVKFGFAELGLHRIWAKTNADNTGSLRLLEKLGMRQEGRLREKEYFKGRWWDTLIYAVLVNEW